jgi:hypothetical protein
MASQPRQFKKDYTNKGISPDLNGINYARPLKLTKVEKYFKRGYYACAVIFKLSRLLVKSKFTSLDKPSILSKGNMTFNDI